MLGGHEGIVIALTHQNFGFHLTRFAASLGPRPEVGGRGGLTRLVDQPANRSAIVIRPEVQGRPKDHWEDFEKTPAALLRGRSFVTGVIQSGTSLYTFSD